jgi:hypothetical protein
MQMRRIPFLVGEDMGVVFLWFRVNLEKIDATLYFP